VKESSVLKRQTGLSVSWRKRALWAGDAVILNLALLTALVLRYVSLPSYFSLAHTFIAFNTLHVMWLLVFYSTGLYDITSFMYPRDIEKKCFESLGLCSIIAIIFFYTIPYFKINPKTILALDLVFSSIGVFLWRKAFIVGSHNFPKMRILLCGSGVELKQLEEFLAHKSHLGYELGKSLVIEEQSAAGHSGLKDWIEQRLEEERVDVLAVTANLPDMADLRGYFYQLVCRGVNVVGFSRLYEEFTGKIPVSMLNEGWLLDNIWEFDKRGFELAKRALDLAVTSLLFIPTLLFFPLVALGIKLDSSGPVLFRQTRVGKDGMPFDLVKFRSMIHNAEREGARWAVEGDQRITSFGKFLRKTRIDELPQLWNVIQGSMSLVGPRPERPEFVHELARTIPFYETRHLVKPGLTGWAQVSFRYGASIEDAREKLQYDLYYVKNRSIPLEGCILLKTVSTMLRYQGR
jgi:exopolysaccharide biosynthesis polyprenyl glycosylphosphotransferase